MAIFDDVAGVRTAYSDLRRWPKNIAALQSDTAKAAREIRARTRADMMTLQESKGAKILFAFGGEGTACNTSDLELCKACPSPDRVLIAS